MEREKKDYPDYEPGHKFSDLDKLSALPGDDNGIDLSAVAKEQEINDVAGEGEDSVMDVNYIEDDPDEDDEEDDEDSLFHG